MIIFQILFHSRLNDQLCLLALAISHRPGNDKSFLISYALSTLFPYLFTIYLYTSSDNQNDKIAFTFHWDYDLDRLPCASIGLHFSLFRYVDIFTTCAWQPDTDQLIAGLRTGHVSSHSHSSHQGSHRHHGGLYCEVNQVFHLVAQSEHPLCELQG